ncbi:hypothetical protein CARUB_v10021916mg [Capsella rubella]|uniref:Steroid 5-alpha reductase C-terminal domain-containing protein n=1 Tax=Capsella rubella TaxID=81985 RepID=R0HX05_9BRAS|nr:hypothetical protein CARUB_v10021916mg [Capsella rubella]
MGTVLDSHFLALTAIVTVVYQFIFFVITALFKFDQVTDFAGTTIFSPLFPFAQICCSPSFSVTILQWGEDRRFDEQRGNLVRLIIFWTLQSPFGSHACDLKLEFLFPFHDVIGWTMWVFGFLIEAAADQQKLSFKNSPENRGKWCDVGVWKYSRHPNYFGELICFYLRSIFSPLILLPRGVYGNLPGWCKTIFLFEFPFYNRNLPQEVAV